MMEHIIREVVRATVWFWGFEESEVVSAQGSVGQLSVLCNISKKLETIRFGNRNTVYILS